MEGGTERLHWNAFEKKARTRDPLGNKLDYMYYERIREAYRAQTESYTTLDPWLKGNGMELQVTSERRTEDNQYHALRRDPER